MLTVSVNHILRATTYFIDSIDDNVDVEVVIVGNWLSLTYDDECRNNGVYILRQMLKEKDMFLRGRRYDVLVDKIVASCRTIYTMLNPTLSAQLVDLLVKICQVKYNNHIPDKIIDDLRQLASLIAGGYTMNDFLSGREQREHNTISDEVYAVLEITPTATDEEVMKAFRRLSLQYHPDRLINATQEEKEWASRKLQAIVEAKKIIMDYRKKTNNV